MTEEFDMASAVADVGADLFDEEPSGGQGELDFDEGSPEERGEGESAAAAVAKPAPEKEGAAEASADPAKDLPPVPKTWRAEAAAEWAAIPEKARAEILKREQDVFNGIEALKPDATIGRALRPVLAPYEQIFSQYNINPAAQVKSLLDAHYTLAFGQPEQKLGLIRSLLKDYQIDIGQVTAVEDDFVDPQVKALQQELHTLKSSVQSFQQERQAQVMQGLQSEVETFAKRTDVPHLKVVYPVMVDLLQKGISETLQDAYDKACKLHPETAQAMLEVAVKEKADKARAEAAERVAKVRTATAASVRTDARSGSAAAALGDLDDTIAESLAKIRSRSS